MRIIAGEYRGRMLRSPSGARTRPTADRLRETLFNILSPRIDAATRFLDLCAGTGAVGIEAISRGAGFAAFVDRSRRACGLIEENLDQLEVPEGQTKIFCGTAEKFVVRDSTENWDLIFYDPPYKTDYRPVLSAVGKAGSRLLAKDGLLIVEHHSKTSLPETAGTLRRWRIVKQGESYLSFFEKQ